MNTRAEEGRVARKLFVKWSAGVPPTFVKPKFF
jgi:hypothetical protein